MPGFDRRVGIDILAHALIAGVYAGIIACLMIWRLPACFG